MIDILAQATETAARGAEYYGTLLGTALFVLLGGGAGGALIHRRVTKPQREEHAHRDVCPLHDSTMQLLEERKNNADDDRRDIKAAVQTLSENTTKGFDAVFRKLDGMDSYLRNRNT
jgi:GTP-sensing pleiotropic transcriptional regulator CodY